MKRVDVINDQAIDRFCRDIPGGQNTGKKIFFSGEDKIEDEVDLGKDGL